MIPRFINKKDCYGCSACMNVCQCDAIIMQADQDGFLFPEINDDACIGCGLCKKVCPFNSLSLNSNEPVATFAAINKNLETLSSSSSGGVFAALATIALLDNGVVYGCTLTNEINPEHICIENLSDIKKLQGSKYVQSKIGNSYKETKNYLEAGTLVLFTGTPCQIAGLKSYLGKDYKNLITADIICHGVPSPSFFKEYIRCLQGKLKCKVLDFNFRDKSNGWGLLSRVTYKKGDKIMKKTISPILSYYYGYFLSGDIYRECCYDCKYACCSREGDFTMGDYWGIENVHPQIEIKNGVSVLLVNTEKGMELINNLQDELIMIKSTFDNAQLQNLQLKKPSEKSNKRDTILKIWREGGYEAISGYYYRTNLIQIIVFRLKMLIPQILKKEIRRILSVCSNQNILKRN